ncbi:MAG: nucleotidyltransferase family protein [Phycisphaeraceae bacterium]
MRRIYHGIEFDPIRIADFCRHHGIRKLSLFGSILTDDFQPDSDIDVLVEFGPQGTPSLLDLGGMLMELTDMFGRQVDLKTWGFMSDRIRRQVERQRQVQYAA